MTFAGALLCLEPGPPLWTHRPHLPSRSAHWHVSCLTPPDPWCERDGLLLGKHTTLLSQPYKRLFATSFKLIFFLPQHIMSSGIWPWVRIFFVFCGKHIPSVDGEGKATPLCLGVGLFLEGVNFVTVHRSGGPQRPGRWARTGGKRYVFLSRPFLPCPRF